MKRSTAALLAAFTACGPAGAEVRVISAPGLTPGPVVTGPLQRIEMPGRTTAATIDDGRPPGRLMPTVVMESAIAFRSKGLRIRLPEVAAVDADVVCRDEEGASWMCGQRARAAVSTLARLNGILCPLPEEASEGEFELSCRLGGVEMAERIVASGWAKAQPGGRWVEAEARARRERRGIWGPAPARPFETTPATPLPEELPRDVTMAPMGALRP